MPSGIFAVQQDFDSKYVIVPINFAKELLEYNSQITSLEIALDPDDPGKSGWNGSESNPHFPRQCSQSHRACSYLSAP